MSGFSATGISSADKASLESAKGSVVNFVTDCGADPTGTTDCTAALNAAGTILASLATDTKLPQQVARLFVPRGRYKVSGSPNIWDFTGVTPKQIEVVGVPNSSIFELNGSGNGVIQANNAYSLTVMDLTFIGTTGGTDARFCLFPDATLHCTIKRCRFLNMSCSVAPLYVYACSLLLEDVDFSGCMSSNSVGATVWIQGGQLGVHLKNVSFPDDGPGLNGYTNPAKVGTFGHLRIDDSASGGFFTRLVQIESCFFDEGCVRAVHIEGGPTSNVPLVRMIGNQFNVSSSGSPTSTIRIKNTDLLEVIGLRDSGLFSSSLDIPVLELISVGSAHLRGISVNASAVSRYFTADTGCGYVEVEDGDVAPVDVRSSATRTVVKTKGGIEDLFTANGTIAAHQLCKNVTGDVVAILTTDVIDVVRGAASAAATATQRVALSRFSTPTTFLSDGTATIAIGDRLGISPSSAGRVRTVSAALDSVGVATGTAAASADALVSAYFEPEPARALYFSLDVTLVAGTKTQASGKDLTNATLVNVRLKTPTTATGDPVVTFVAGANGNVTVTSYTAGAIQTATDASTYTCVFSGAV